MSTGIFKSKRKGVRPIKKRIVLRKRKNLRRSPFDGNRMVSRTFRAPAVSVKVITNRGRNVTRVTHREYIDAVLSPQAAFSYNLQPTNTGMFTWLPRVAQCYEMYRPVSFEVFYENTTGTEESGAVHMAVDYDVLDDVVPDAHSMSQFTTYVRTGLWKAARMPLNISLCNRVPWRYTAAHGYPAVSDQKTYDFGRLWVMAVGSQDPAITAGEIFVEYTFEFCSPTVEVVSSNTITMSLTPAPSTSYFEQALSPTVAVSTGQKLLEYIATNSVALPQPTGTTINKYAHIYRALHNFAGEIIAEGGVPISAANRAMFSSNQIRFGESDSPTGPFSEIHHGDSLPYWRTPVLDHGSSASDLVASNLAISALEMIKGKYYAFPWNNASTGAVTGWSTPDGIARNLIYYISERLPNLAYMAAIPQICRDDTCSSTDNFTKIESDEDDDPVLVVRRKR